MERGASDELMEFSEVVRRRKMVRSFEDRPVPSEVLDRILDNALHAPSAGFSQGWAFVVLQGAETSLFWDASYPAHRREGFAYPKLFDAPVLILCLSHMDAYLDRYAEPDKGWTDRDPERWPVPYWDIDTGMASLLMLLTAVDEGLGALFFGVFAQEDVRGALGIPDAYAIVGTIAIGYPAPGDTPSPSLQRGRRPQRDVVHRGYWKA